MYGRVWVWLVWRLLPHSWIKPLMWSVVTEKAFPSQQKPLRKWSATAGNIWNVNTHEIIAGEKPSDKPDTYCSHSWQSTSGWANSVDGDWMSCVPTHSFTIMIILNFKEHVRQVVNNHCGTFAYIWTSLKRYMGIICAGKLIYYMYR